MNSALAINSRGSLQGAAKGNSAPMAGAGAFAGVIADVQGASSQPGDDSGISMHFSAASGEGAPVADALSAVAGKEGGAPANSMVGNPALGMMSGGEGFTPETALDVPKDPGGPSKPAPDPAALPQDLALEINDLAAQTKGAGKVDVQPGTGKRKRAGQEPSAETTTPGPVATPVVIPISAAPGVNAQAMPQAQAAEVVRAAGPAPAPRLKRAAFETAAMKISPPAVIASGDGALPDAVDQPRMMEQLPSARPAPKASAAIVTDPVSERDGLVAAPVTGDRNAPAFGQTYPGQPMGESRKGPESMPASLTAVADIVQNLPPIAQSQLAPAISGDAVAVRAATDVGATLSGQVIDMGVGGQWIDRVAKEITALAQGTGHSRFQLNPPNLGRLQIDIWQGEGGGHVQLLTETDEAAQRLRQDQASLQADARLSALSLDRIVIDRAPAAFGASQDHNAQGNTGRQHGSGGENADRAGNQAGSQPGNQGTAQNGGNSGSAAGQGKAPFRRDVFNDRAPADVPDGRPAGRADDRHVRYA